MGGDGFGGGLLQRLVGEQPARRVRDLRRGLAPQQRRLHQCGGTLAERCSRRSDVGDERGVGQPISGHLAQRPLPRLATQIGDGFKVEIYDGLTPVTMTL
jgi:hypothetical protein